MLHDFGKCEALSIADPLRAIIVRSPAAARSVYIRPPKMWVIEIDIEIEGASDIFDQFSVLVVMLAMGLAMGLGAAASHHATVKSLTLRPRAIRTPLAMDIRVASGSSANRAFIFVQQTHQFLKVRS